MAHVRSHAERRNDGKTKMNDGTSGGASASVCVCVRVCARTCAAVHCHIIIVCARRVRMRSYVCICDRVWHLNEANGIDFPRRHWYSRDGRPSSRKKRNGNYKKKSRCRTV